MLGARVLKGRAADSSQTSTRSGSNHNLDPSFWLTPLTIIEKLKVASPFVQHSEYAFPLQNWAYAKARNGILSRASWQEALGVRAAASKIGRRTLQIGIISQTSFDFHAHRHLNEVVPEDVL